MSVNFDIIDMETAIAQLSLRRSVFTSEADFQLELAWQLKEMYPNAKIRMEYCPLFDQDMHIDILVITDGLWIPIELKYKTMKAKLADNGEVFSLKGHSAKDINCYLYLHDIQRIETVKGNCPDFAEGYTVMLTNDLAYTRPPARSSCNYADFSLHNGAVKHGTLDWGANTGDGTKHGCNNPINLMGSYPITWNHYSKIGDSPAGTFMVLINRIQ